MGGMTGGGMTGGGMSGGMGGMSGGMNAFGGTPSNGFGSTYGGADPTAEARSLRNTTCASRPTIVLAGLLARLPSQRFIMHVFDRTSRHDQIGGGQIGGGQ